MHDLRSADAQENSEHFQICDLLSQGWIEAAAALFDEAKVKSRRASDRLPVGRGRPGRIQYKIVIAEGNGRMLPLSQVRHRIFKAASEVGILQRVAVSGPPLRIHGQLLQIGEPPVLRHARYSARRQNGKLAKVDGFRTLGLQVI